MRGQLTMVAFYVAVVGCESGSTQLDDYWNHPLDRVVKDASKDPSDSTKILHAKPFQLVWQEGDGQYGYDTLKIRGDGKCSYTFWDKSVASDMGQQWKRAYFTVSDGTVRELRRFLVDARVHRLEKEYYANVADGATMFVSVQAGLYSKEVYCSNHFPSPIRRMRKFVQDKVLKPQRAALGSAASIAREDAETLLVKP